ncbi:hypothetical protein EV421DRAFT_1912129 [Armillaria borealis]|uniref:Uncharacterized protein n=1 Tax=Armillaria borealis TaxID=47425 RepID=A0AA39IWJ9_9AGAR|nr:hypothetical protein EV421DRAFT_1912129 [Armillaria borealis]
MSHALLTKGVFMGIWHTTLECHAQGFLHFIQTDIDEYGYVLPPGCFLIKPITWTFRHEIQNAEGKCANVSVTREQMPFQAGFACTGQVMQGQTMPSVLAYMNEGGFAAYVAVSCATCREGLFVAHPVQLEQLNQALPVDLVKEMRKFDAMAWNTLIRYGFREGSKVPVEDTVGLPYLLVPKPPPADKPVAVKAILKRPSEEGKLDMGSKRCRQQVFDANSVFQALRQYGCTWNKQDWSCAYDTVCTSFLYIYLSLCDDQKQNFARATALTDAMARRFGDIDLTEIRISREPANVM